ncbi:MarR family winged helix-turn-helix transcriptional regulator [Aeromicrobium sp. Leaf350]|uniref:MarR family winged helix-turn-helix transcriptional regulator n=1 Tax=Aeromicrobium sp. Leaf350 TaxID=2876565 RepID=UPI001E542B24|nr:MarR family transcriptional regulator [Aeromicrobium sp. Leaf350]
MPATAQEIALAVARLNRRLRQERHSELTPTQLSVLGSLRSTGPTTPGALAAHEKVSPPSITRTLSSLAELGMTDRAPHPDDGRQVVVSVSELGEKVLSEERERRDAWLYLRLQELDPTDREVLTEAARILTRLAES